MRSVVSWAGGKREHTLTDLNLQLYPGAHGVTGRNGAGKTTFLELLTGELDPDEGIRTASLWSVG
ncbi:ATP-binding cassette domain-containing protein [Corynebacterium sp. CCM 9203]|uniref:ATP-binding cassette domain-containing protein n=1 Tax=Corynebacterium sp. CCM 9203 TaxID=3057615 RepID=UPI0035254FF1